MSQKKEEISNLLIAVAFDTSFKKLNEELESRNIEITPRSITIVIKICMEIAEATRLKGKEQKVLVERLVKKVVKDAPISDEKEKLLLDMIDQGVLGNTVDLVVQASKGELDVNAAVAVAAGCCASFMKRKKK
jgi:hypothetical protein